MGCYTPSMIKGLQEDFNPEGLYPCVLCMFVRTYPFFLNCTHFAIPHRGDSKGRRGGKVKNIRPCSESVTSQTPGNQVYSSAMSFAKSNTTPSPYHPSTKEMGVENFKMYNRFNNQQP